VITRDKGRPRKGGPKKGNKKLRKGNLSEKTKIGRPKKLGSKA